MEEKRRDGGTEGEGKGRVKQIRKGKKEYKEDRC